MRREHQIVQSGGDDDKPTIITDMRVVNGVITDTVTNTNPTIESNAAVYDSTYMYNTGSSRRIRIAPLIDGIVKPLYMTKNGKWEGSNTPNPPTNGVSSDYYNGKIRIITETYYPTFYSSRYILTNCDRNNTAYRGISLMTGSSNGAFTFGEQYTSYNSFSYSKSFTFSSVSASNPMIIQIDFTEDQYRLKVLNIDGTVIFDSEVRNCLTSGTHLGIMHGAYHTSRVILQYVKYYTIYDGTTVSGFLE